MEDASIMHHHNQDSPSSPNPAEALQTKMEQAKLEEATQ
jgi:hypothetical protein